MKKHTCIKGLPSSKLLLLVLVMMIGIFCFSLSVAANNISNSEPLIATFSIAASDSATGELGVAVASKFFAVGNVVPWAKTGIGAVATQAFANTTFGWRGLDLLEQGLAPDEIIDLLVRNDNNPEQRQFGIVSADGNSATFTGDSCLHWAGGRSGPNYAVQGNILAGESVVIAMENAFLNSEGNLADRMYAALLAGDAEGGDARGRQSAALLVVKDSAGYGGYTDRAIDIRVDDHIEPFKELGRILNIAQMNYGWNEAWTLFTKKQYTAALPHMERTAKLAPESAAVLYDLAVIRLAVGNKVSAMEALKKSLRLNPRLALQAIKDNDLAGLHGDTEFEKLVDK